MSEKSLAERINETCPTQNLDVSDYGEGCHESIGTNCWTDWCEWPGHALAQEVDEALLMARGAQRNAEGLLEQAEKRIKELEAMKP